MLLDAKHKEQHPDNTFDELDSGYKTPVERMNEGERTSDVEGGLSPTGHAEEDAEAEPSPAAPRD